MKNEVIFSGVRNNNGYSEQRERGVRHDLVTMRDLAWGGEKWGVGSGEEEEEGEGEKLSVTY